MELKLQRERPIPGVGTFGVLYIDGTYTCNTIERDQVLASAAEVAAGRELEPGFTAVKVPGVTALPAGRYEAALSYSDKFNGALLELLGTPGFTSCRFHVANSQEDVEGCIGVGTTRIIKDGEALPLRGSKTALKKIMREALARWNREKIWVELVNWS